MIKDTGVVCSSRSISQNKEGELEMLACHQGWGEEGMRRQNRSALATLESKT